MAKMKYKKQFRLYDIYRYAVTNEQSHIEGIDYYNVNKDASIIHIKFPGIIGAHKYIARNEDELKEVVRQVNKKLGNCSKPGPMRRHK